jgi:ribose transport system substrate-binding protein
MHVSTTWPGPSVPVKPPAKKQKLGIVTCGPYAGCLQNGQGAAQGAQALGWQSTILNPTTGSPEEVNGDIEKLINGGATAIIWGGWPSSILGPAIAAAKRAHIPTASIESGETTPTDINEGAKGAPFQELGALIGWWMIANSNGHAQVGLLSDNEYTTGQDIDKGLESVLAQCPGCKIVARQDIPAAQEQTLAPTDTVAMLRANPSINYMFVPFDSRVPYVIEGVREAGKPNVQIASEQPGTASINALTAHQPTLDATVQSSEIWAGWATFDQLLREMAHQPLVYHPLPLILTTKANAKVPTYVPLSKTNAIDYPTEFKKLWGVGT